MPKSWGLGLLLRLRKSGEAGRVFLRNPRPAGRVRPATVAPAPGRPRPRLEGPGQRFPAVTPLLPSCASLFQPLSTARMIFSRARHLALAHADARPRRGPGPRAQPGAAFPWLGGSAPQSPLLGCRGADVLIPPPHRLPGLPRPAGQPSLSASASSAGGGDRGQAASERGIILSEGNQEGAEAGKALCPPPSRLTGGT